MLPTVAAENKIFCTATAFLNVAMVVVHVELFVDAVEKDRE